MKKTFKRLSAILLVLFLSASLTVPVLAADSTVTYAGHDEIEFAPGSSYTETDLFDELKQVMPGSTQEETITIKNEYDGCDYIKVYLYAKLHDETENPLSDSVKEQLTDDPRREQQSELDYMYDFLNRMTLTVWDEEDMEAPIYTGVPQYLEDEEGEAILVATLDEDESASLLVELEFSLAIDNEYAARIGEVDWVFKIEERDRSGGGGGGGEIIIPDPIIPDPIVPDPETPPVEPPVPPESPKTGDDTVVLPYIALFGIGLLGMVLTTIGKKKQKRES